MTDQEKHLASEQQPIENLEFEIGDEVLYKRIRGGRAEGVLAKIIDKRYHRGVFVYRLKPPAPVRWYEGGELKTVVPKMED
jgi:hypothetical protein